jgi:hypothetical protein
MDSEKPWRLSIKNQWERNCWGRRHDMKTLHGIATLGTRIGLQGDHGIGNIAPAFGGESCCRSRTDPAKIDRPQRYEAVF